MDPFPPRFMALAFALGIRLQADVERRRRCSAIGRVSVYGSCCSTSFSNDVQTDASVATRVAHFLIVTLRRSRFLSQLEGVRELLRWRSLPIAELGDVCASANAVLIVSELTHVLFFSLRIRIYWHDEQDMYEIAPKFSQMGRGRASLNSATNLWIGQPGRRPTKPHMVFQKVICGSRSSAFAFRSFFVGPMRFCCASVTACGTRKRRAIGFVWIADSVRPSRCQNLQ